MVAKTAGKKKTASKSGKIIPFKVTVEEGMGEGKRFFVSHPKAESAIRIGSFLRLLGAEGAKLGHVELLLKEAGSGIHAAKQAAPPTHTSINTVNSQMNSGFRDACGLAGTVNAAGRNRCHHGTVVEADNELFGSLVREAIAYYAAKTGEPARLIPAASPAKKVK